MMSERQVNQKKAASVSTLKGLTFTPNGSPMAPVYKRVFNKDANKNLVTKVDETNLQEFIEASASQTDLALLQKRFVELGEIPSNPNLIPGIDTTIMPDNIHGVYDMVNDVDANFKQLPKSIQEIFGNNPQTYLSALLDGSYQATIIKALQSKKEEAPKPEAPKGE